MIDAILRGKLPITEDVFTSCVVGLLAKLPRERGLLAWLERARPFGAAVPLRFGPLATHEVYFWPQTARHGEPDVLVVVLDGSRRHAILIEAKYWAPKSNWNTLEDDDPRRDQLARYWAALCSADLSGVSPSLIRESEKLVVFVTQHAAPPTSDLQSSIAASKSNGMKLAWLSWQDAWSPVSDEVATRTAPEDPVGAWLCLLLEHLGLTHFRGFGSLSPLLPTGAPWHFDRGGFDALSEPRLIHPGAGWKY